MTERFYGSVIINRRHGWMPNKLSHNRCLTMYMGLHLNSRSRPHARRERLNAGIPLTCFLAERPYHTSLKDMAGYKSSSLDTCRLGPQQVPKSPPRPHAAGFKKTSCWIVQNGHLPWVGVGCHYPAPVPSPAVQDSGLDRNVHGHLRFLNICHTITHMAHELESPLLQNSEYICSQLT